MSDENSSPTLLVGHSMGGLVARYALKTMENKSEKHNVGTYVSYDSPHLGANVPKMCIRDRNTAYSGSLDARRNN